MPVILAPETVAGVARREAAEPALLKTMLAPYPVDRMAGQRLHGNVKNNDPALVEPITSADGRPDDQREALARIWRAGTTSPGSGLEHCKTFPSARLSML